MFSQQPSKIDPKKVERLAFGAGGAAGGAYAGVMIALAIVPGFTFDNIISAVGSSVGAVAALAVCLKLTPEQMFDKLNAIDFSKLTDIGSIKDILRRITLEQTLYKGDAIYEQLLKLLSEVTDRYDPANITFKYLKDRGFKDLYVVTTEIYNSEPEPSARKVVWSYETTPNAPVAAVVRASCAAYPYFPGMMFKRDKFGNYTVLDLNTNDPYAHLHVDGAFLDSFPLKIWDHVSYVDPTLKKESKINAHDHYSDEMFEYETQNKKINRSYQKENIINNHVLGFNLTIDYNKSLQNRSSLYPGNPYKLIKALANGIFSNTVTDYRTIHVNRKLSLTEFNIPTQKKIKVILAGIKAVHNYFNISLDDHQAYYSNFLKKINDECKKVTEFSSMAHWLMWGIPPVLSEEINGEKDKEADSSFGLK